jgi:uncharacterized membrane protein YfcA
MMQNSLLCLLLGLVAGALSGFLGLGGGIIIVPALVYIFGYTQHMAQGTTLALMVPPIGLLAAWSYYKAGAADLKVAAVICLGFFVGGLLGAKVALNVPDDVLRKVFGIWMLAIGAHMVFFK